MAKTSTSRIGRRMRERETLIGSSPRGARRQGIRVRPRVTAASGRSVAFADGTRLAPAAVVWATGFAMDHGWIDVPVFAADGSVVHERGVTPSPGLSFLGLPWQHTRGSALLGWVRHDAEHLAGHIAAAARRGATVRAAAGESAVSAGDAPPRDG
jgi:putative flavoprotein involved in K+ transport